MRQPLLVVWLAAVLLSPLACMADLTASNHFTEAVVVESAGQSFNIQMGQSQVLPVSANYVVKTQAGLTIGTVTWVDGDNEVHVHGLSCCPVISTWHGSGVLFWFLSGFGTGFGWGGFGMIVRMIRATNRASAEL